MTAVYDCVSAALSTCWLPVALQDDMQLAIDFFPYFRRSAQLLDEDPTLYCVSSWNDNGQVRCVVCSKLCTSSALVPPCFPSFLELPHVCDMAQ